MKDEWKTVALDEVAEFNPRLPETLAADDNVSFVPMSAVSAETAGITHEETRTYSEVSKGYTPFVSGDVLVAKITPCFENGKIAQARLTQKAGFGSTEFHVVRAHPTKLDARYTLHFLRLGHVRLAGERRMTGSAGQRRVPENFLAKLEIPLPPLAEQRQIAEVLDRAEALRAKRRAALSQLDSLTQSLFLDLFGDPIKNPHGFPVRPMIELIDPQRPISYGILMPGPDQAEGVKYVRVTDMKNGGIELSGIRKTTEAMSNSFRRSLLKPADLLMSIRGHVGRFAVIPPELDGANITQDSARLAIVGASSVYVRECLRTEGFQRWMAKHTKGVAVRGINLGDVKLMPILLPPRPAQDKFARQANAVEALKTAQRASLAELDALFATLQHRAFRGEL